MSKQAKLFIGNLPYKITEDELHQLFSSFGDITDIKIPVDRESGRKRGFAFVTFSSADIAEQALSMDGTEVGGRTIRVNFAENKNQRGGSQSGGGEGYHAA